MESEAASSGTPVETVGPRSALLVSVTGEEEREVVSGPPSGTV